MSVERLGDDIASVVVCLDADADTDDCSVITPNTQTQAPKACTGTRQSEPINSSLFFFSTKEKAKSVVVCVCVCALTPCLLQETLRRLRL